MAFLDSCFYKRVNVIDADMQVRISKIMKLVGESRTYTQKIRLG